VHVVTRSRDKPGANLVGFMRAVVVHDQMDVPISGNGRIDLV
jgi:hypothetical protein